MAAQRPQFTLDERVFMVVTYHETQSPVEVIRRFRLQFPNSRVPFRHTVTRNYQKYLASGTSRNLNSGHSGRHRTGRSQLNIAQVRLALQRDPTITCRRNPLPNIHSATFNRITRYYRNDDGVCDI